MPAILKTDLELDQAALGFTQKKRVKTAGMRVTCVQVEICLYF